MDLKNRKVKFADNEFLNDCKDIVNSIDEHIAIGLNNSKKGCDTSTDDSSDVSSDDTKNALEKSQ